uniref:ATP synthase subunit a n=1 Tax=Evacanthus acuminatus TaxID=139555 RepID=A0A6N0A2E0_9HEMI|nr:ATP synthase F0 subunit 6 [Evacanthus bivittatus]QKO00202.1 ATP synthase F0 subunit 6 [Evacanthus acuminatus]WGC90084.1 ATP synthase F0 subunit 6 [Evacanthus bivittatus]
MMTNLFSVFDPCTGIFSLNWLSTIIFILIIPYNFWFIPNKLSLIYNNLLITLNLEMSMLMPYKGMTMFMLSIFFLILVNNSMGLVPYVFTSSSHLMFSLSLALPMWLSFMIYGWFNNTNMMFTHLVPIGTPFILMPFMVMIETISNLIRPGSLAVRLTANMIAGHLLMSLLGNSSLSMMVILMFVFIILMSFEIAVSAIQAYVFMTLTTLYSSEV